MAMWRAMRTKKEAKCSDVATALKPITGIRPVCLFGGGGWGCASRGCSGVYVCVYMVVQEEHDCKQ